MLKRQLLRDIQQHAIHKKRGIMNSICKIRVSFINSLSWFEKKVHCKWLYACLLQEEKKRERNNCGCTPVMLCKQTKAKHSVQNAELNSIKQKISSVFRRICCHRRCYYFASILSFHSWSDTVLASWHLWHESKENEMWRWLSTLAVRNLVRYEPLMNNMTWRKTVSLRNYTVEFLTSLLSQ